MHSLPRLLFTMGDVAGIGPEIIAKAWPELAAYCQPIVVGDVAWMRRANAVLSSKHEVIEIAHPGAAPTSGNCIPCIQGSSQNLDEVQPGVLCPAAGRAAYDFLCSAIDLTMKEEAAGIVTLPLHKEGLHAAGLDYPGHTEILAEKTGVRDFAMMLYARGPRVPHGLGVVHVTLHMALRDVFEQITTAAVLAKIRLLNGVMTHLCDRSPRLAVAALNPHASDGGLFGSEERTLIAPAVAQCGPRVSKWPGRFRATRCS